MRLEGIVVRIHAKHCEVSLQGRNVRCALRGKLFGRTRRQRHPIAVGDRVEVELRGEDEGVLEAMLPRRSRLSRATAGGGSQEQVLAANVDQVIITGSLHEPELNLNLIDRLLVTSHVAEIEPLICVNKMDLIETPGDTRRLEEARRYTELDYRVVFTSVVTGDGIDRLRQALAHRISVFAGPSGAGKSSILNAVQPGLELRVGAVSAAHGKGTHTTSRVSLLTLDIGGYVVDTPGVREFSPWDLPREDLGFYFPEIARRQARCRFRGCTHTHEPDCAVKAALEQAEIDPRRYQSYCNLFASLEEGSDLRREERGGRH